MVSGHAIIKCPFCGQMEVKAFHKPSYLEGHTSRISSGAKTKFYRVPESYTVVGGCPNCGKSEKDIQKELDGKVTKELSHEEHLKRLKEAGLPTRIEWD